MKPAIEGGTPVREEPPPIGPLIDVRDVEFVVEVLKSRMLTSNVGNVTSKFEEEFAGFLGVSHAVAVSNGTAALLVALKACDIGPGDEVIVPSFTFIATATSVLHANAIPIFADVDPETYTISPESVEEKISKRTKAIIAVHLFGHPADIDSLKKIADKYGLILIEDSAQAIGAEYKGKKTGALGDVGVFSFYPTKNITSGEGGMIVTGDSKIAEKARLIRNHGQTGYYYHEELGYNLRMSELHAALGLSQLEKIEEFNKVRRRHAKIYHDNLRRYSDIIKLPVEKDWAKSSWTLYELTVDFTRLKIDRDRFVEAVKAENVHVGKVYPRVLYENPIFQFLRGHGKGCPWTCPIGGGKTHPYIRVKTPTAEHISRSCVTLHTDPIMGEDGVLDTIKALEKIIEYYMR